MSDDLFFVAVVAVGLPSVYVACSRVHQGLH